MKRCKICDQQGMLKIKNTEKYVYCDCPAGENVRKICERPDDKEWYIEISKNLMKEIQLKKK